MRPVIGLIPLIEDEKLRYWMRPGYMKGVSMAGGLPVMLPLTADEDELADIASMCDGLLLTGGPDVEPAMYGQETLPVGVVTCPPRDAMESRLYPLFMAQDKPVFGICRGIQMLNVLCGGTLYQDIPAQHPSEIAHHQQAEREARTHEVRVLPSTPLREIAGQDVIRVNSFHHEAIDRLGEGLAPMGVSPDGLIEAVWMPERRFVWGVQWHPEYLWPTDAAAAGLFRAFVDACRR